MKLNSSFTFLLHLFLVILSRVKYLDLCSSLSQPLMLDVWKYGTDRDIIYRHVLPLEKSPPDNTSHNDSKPKGMMAPIDGSTKSCIQSCYHYVRKIVL